MAKETKYLAQVGGKDAEGAGLKVAVFNKEANNWKSKPDQNKNVPCKTWNKADLIHPKFYPYFLIYSYQT